VEAGSRAGVEALRRAFQRSAIALPRPHTL
jgi:hypothetical protein